jgi:predicted 3-demethylubiquinone-9 3-methyltransferase (glyoxalase superfamily)
VVRVTDAGTPPKIPEKNILNLSAPDRVPRPWGKFQFPDWASWKENKQMPIKQRITPFLWFDSQAEVAAKFYVSIFPNSKVGSISRYGEAGPGPKGSVMTVGFELDGLSFTALNGGPSFKFTEAISLVVHCETQAEVDHYWNKLSAGGSEVQCGWLKDKYGLSWQVVPRALIELIQDKDPAKSQRVLTAMLQMKKIDIAGLKAAYAAA